jgi:hypothetical protein
VITSTPLRKRVFDTAQPVSVLAGEALVTRREGSLGSTGRHGKRFRADSKPPDHPRARRAAGADLPGWGGDTRRRRVVG